MAQLRVRFLHAHLERMTAAHLMHALQANLVRPAVGFVHLYAGAFHQHVGHHFAEQRTHILLGRQADATDLVQLERFDGRRRQQQLHG